MTQCVHTIPLRLNADRPYHQNMSQPPAPREQEPYTPDLWNEDDKRSLINLLPTEFGHQIKEIVGCFPELFDKDERDLRRELKSQQLVPTPTMNRLRMKFWWEYERAQTRVNRMRIVEIYSGICTKQTWDKMLTYAHNVAWILCPPVNYVVAMEEALLYGIEQMRDILEEDIRDPKTNRLSVSLVMAKLEIIKLLDQRVKGAVTQRIEQKSMNVNVSTSTDTVTKLADNYTTEELQKILDQLQGVNQSKSVSSGVIEVESKLVDES